MKLATMHWHPCTSKHFVAETWRILKSTSSTVAEARWTSCLEVRLRGKITRHHSVSRPALIQQPSGWRFPRTSFSITTTCSIALGANLGSARRGGGTRTTPHVLVLFDLSSKHRLPAITTFVAP